MNLSLREMLRKRIQEDIIGSEKEDNCIGTVFVLDEYSSALLSKVLKLPELIQKGVTMVESIQKLRKPYASFRAIYLVEPTRENFAAIQRDFAQNSCYGGLHVYTTRNISDEIFQFVAAQSFVKRCQTLKEANVEFRPLTPSLFTLATDKRVEGIISVISCLRNVKRVELYRAASDGQNAQFQRTLGARVKAILPALQTGEDGLRVRVFIIDRGVDLVTPLLHDFHYESLLMDLMREALAAEPPRELNEDDDVFEKYRYRFIRETMTGVSADFEAFLRDNPAAQMLKNRDKADAMKLEQMADVVAGLGQYNNLVDDYNWHIAKIQQILREAERVNAQQLADAELAVVSGVDAGGEVLDAGDRIDLAKRLLPTLSQDNALRLALIAEGCLYKGVSALRALLSPPNQKAFDAFSALVAKYGRYWPESDKERFKEMTVELYKRVDSSLKRHIVKVEFLLKEFLMGREKSLFEAIAFGAPPTNVGKSVNTLFKIKMKNAKAEAKEVVLVYFTCGASYTEVRALRNLEDELDGVRIFVGGDALYNPKSFLDEFVFAAKTSL